MPGSVVVNKDLPDLRHEGPRLVVVDWTGDAVDGSVPVAAIGAPGGRIAKVDCLALDANGGVANYDVEVLDAEDLDVLGQAATGRKIVDGGDLVVSQVTPLVGSLYRPVPVVGQLRLQVTNPNPGAQGRVKIYLEI